MFNLQDLLKRLYGTGKLEDEINIQSYENALYVIEHRAFELSCGECDREIMLRSFRKAISLDLTYSNIAKIAYLYRPNPYNLQLPDHYYNKDGERVFLKTNYAAVPLKDNYVIETPSDTKKWMKHLLRKENLDLSKFKERPPLYYPRLNLIMQGAGSVRRTAEAFINRPDNIILALCLEDKDIYMNVITDGAYWIDKHSGRKIEKVHDYRLALIFTIKQMELYCEQERIK